MQTARWIDTHAHLDASEFAADHDAVRQRARQAGVTCCVIPAVSLAHFDGVRTLAHAQHDAYAWGIHPLYTPQASLADLAQLDAALHDNKDDPHLVAVGEIGLDGFVPELNTPEARAHQEALYHAQLRLAQHHALPVILHVRRSVDTVLQTLRKTRVMGGIAHAFNGSLQQAQAFLSLGFKLGFGGALTYERALQLRRLVTDLPLTAFVLETDAPDIPPQWLYTSTAQRAAGIPQGRNEPAELPRIAQLIADWRGISCHELAAATYANAHQALPRLQSLA